MRLCGNALCSHLASSERSRWSPVAGSSTGIETSEQAQMAIDRWSSLTTLFWPAAQDSLKAR